MELKKTLEKCMQICSQREYCIFDIENKLQKWEIDKKDQQKIIDTLVLEKFIDHERYVPAFINDKFKFNHWGKIKIRYYLKQKHIDSQIINIYLAQIDDDLYLKTIKNEIKNKRQTAKGKDDFEKNQKVARYVISKGFEPDKVFQLLKLN
ncbi:MAG: regulatory protein RecX [Salinivirgaceae bacterium]|jgi:regulatory protein|nr:regulatory protein RecX [Salinivirgaceae bacterium]